MKLLKLEYLSYYTGDWYLAGVWAVNDFIAHMRERLWSDEVERVRNLCIGQTFTSGDKAPSVWRVTRLYKRPVEQSRYDDTTHRNELVMLHTWMGIAADNPSMSAEELEKEFRRANVEEADDMSYRDDNGILWSPRTSKQEVRTWRRHAKIVLQRRANKTV